jgi:hypothetical protein
LPLVTAFGVLGHLAQGLLRRNPFETIDEVGDVVAVASSGVDQTQAQGGCCERAYLCRPAAQDGTATSRSMGNDIATGGGTVDTDITFDPRDRDALPGGASRNRGAAQPEASAPLDGGMISPPDRTRGRLWGSRPLEGAATTAALVGLRRRDDDEDPGPEPRDPPPPPPPVSVPDIALQFLPCLEDIPVDGDTNLEAALVEALRALFGADADVRYRCLDGRGTVGVWQQPGTGPATSEARDRGMARVAILRAGENFALFLSSAFVRRLADAQWAVTPKRLDGDGRRDSDGPVHLTGMRLQFDAPDRIVTIVDGYDERPWPDVDFEVRIVDELSAAGSAIAVATSSDLDADTTWLNVLTGVFAFLGVTLSPLYLLPAGFFLAESIIVSAADPPDDLAGAGAAAAQLIPAEVMVRGGSKLVATYRRVEVDAGGVYAGGLAVPDDRVPRVEINGASSLTVNENAPAVTSTYRVVTEDLRPDLTVSWGGSGTVVSPGALVTPIRFSAFGIEPGDSDVRRVSVRVSDADGLDDTDEQTVTIHRLIDDPTIPPICNIKPWLPQCREPRRTVRERRASVAGEAPASSGAPTPTPVSHASRGTK